MLKLPRIPTPFLAVALASSAAAQHPNFATGDSIHWPTGSPSGDFTRLLAGDFNGDGLLDAAVLAGTSPCIVDGVAVYDRVKTVPRTCNDFAVAKGAAPNGRDALLLGRSTGVELIYIAESAGVPGFVGSVVANTSPWTGAVRVWSADLNETGQPDYLALASNLRTIVIRRDGVSDATITSPRDVVEVVPAKMDATHALWLAVLTTTTLDIYDHTGALVSSTAAAAPSGDSITSFRNLSTGLDRIAWIDRATDTACNVYTVEGDDAPVLAGALILATNGPQFFTLRAGEATGDAGEDLFFGRTGNYAPLFVQNLLTSSPLFNPFPSLYGANYIPTGSTAALPVTNSVAPLLAGFEGSGVDDMLVADRSSNKLHYLVNEGMSNVIGLGYGKPVFIGGSSMAVGTVNSQRSLELNLRFDVIPANFTPTHIQVVVWKETAPNEIDDTPQQSWGYALPTGTLSTPINARVTVVFNLDSVNSDPCFGETYWLQAQLIKLSGTQVVNIGETAIGALTTCKNKVADLVPPISNCMTVIPLGGSTPACESSSSPCNSCQCDENDPEDCTTFCATCGPGGITQFTPAIVRLRRTPPHHTPDALHPIPTPTLSTNVYYF